MKYIFYLLVFFTTSVFSQGENNNWYFGSYAGITFNSGSPIALTNGALITNEGSAALSDSLGNLLFYTEGLNVYNSNHQLMPNGFGLNGNQSTTQATMIVPMPQNCEQFYIFTINVDTLIPFSYSIVDMTLDAGKGDITLKNIPIWNSVTERLNGTMHFNGIDYWIAVQDFNTNAFIIFLITSSGISSTPLIFPSSYPQGGFSATIGELKFSPDGTRIAYANHWFNCLTLCDFDNLTGNVSNCMTLFEPGFPYGLEFSPDASKLYTSTVNGPFVIRQYDLTSGNQATIQNSQTLIDSMMFEFGGALQLGPDDKIYALRNQEYFLGSIMDPNQTGLLCNYVDSAVSLNGRKGIDGLPNCIKRYSYCNSGTGLSEIHDKKNIILSPNPTSGVLRIEYLNFNIIPSCIEILDLNGRIVSKFTSISASLNKIDLQLDNGYYFIKFIGDSFVETKKLIVN